jgi:hypothetical protein
MTTLSTTSSLAHDHRTTSRILHSRPGLQSTRNSRSSSSSSDHSSPAMPIHPPTSKPTCVPTEPTRSTCSSSARPGLTSSYSTLLSRNTSRTIPRCPMTLRSPAAVAHLTSLETTGTGTSSRIYHCLRSPPVLALSSSGVAPDRARPWNAAGHCSPNGVTGNVKTSSGSKLTPLRSAPLNPPPSPPSSLPPRNTVSWASGVPSVARLTAISFTVTWILTSSFLSPIKPVRLNHLEHLGINDLADQLCILDDRCASQTRGALPTHRELLSRSTPARALWFLPMSTPRLADDRLTLCSPSDQD